MNCIYVPAPEPDNEAERLAALDRYRVFDSTSTSSLDKLTRAAAHIFNAPYAVLSLIGESEQIFKSRYGTGLTGSSRDVSFCGHTILRSEPMVVPDALNDVRFAGNPLVLGKPGIRFYAGAPLRTPDGLKLGALCAFDILPHELPSPSKLRVLQDLADLAVDQFECELVRNQLIQLQPVSPVNP